MSAILKLVPELYTAWHAGISSWEKYKSINEYSIGIEISNPGHNNQYKNYSKQQVKSVLNLGSYLIKKYKIKSKFILGHSDIAYDRKKDPGEKFPWKHLSLNKIGLWHDLSQKKLIKLRNKKIDKLEKSDFLQNLYKIGYTSDHIKKNSKNIKKLTQSYQRRFRQQLINGVIDKECLQISKNLIKKI